ncbi:MAG: sodium:solute symporter family protein [Treponema sp.]|nr:sodium:solute symporter family protein [Treponema sp.]
MLITVVGLYSGKKVKSADDFNYGGRRSGTGLVVGAIVGTIVGGSCTIGTSQLAFHYGLSAWWFTLGCCLGSLVLLFFFCESLYKNDYTTLAQIIAREYGEKAGIAATILNSVGSFLSVVAQILSGIALITAVSHFNSFIAMFIVVALIFVYVVFGGIWGAGYVGIAKTILLYTAITVCGVLALYLQGGFRAFTAALPPQRYFNLFARGVAVDGGAGLSLILGILTTQVYLQVIMMSRTLRIAKNGILISAIIIPLSSIGGILVGYYMKLNYPDIIPAMALPLFILEKMPPLFAGIILATMLVTVVGTGAGMSLGISAMISTDVYKVYINKEANDRQELFVNRFSIVLILIIAAALASVNTGSLIMGWSLLSMGLRGAGAFGPICAALFLPGKIPPVYVLASMILATALVLLGKFFLPPNVDPLFLGTAGNVLTLGIGLLAGRRINRGK